MKVAIQARLKNGILYEAAKKMGSASALARFPEVSASELGAWINFGGVPSPLRTAEGFKQKGDRPAVTGMQSKSNCSRLLGTHLTRYSPQRFAGRNS